MNKYITRKEKNNLNELPRLETIITITRRTIQTQQL